MSDQKIERLERVFKEINKDTLTHEEAAKMFKSLIGPLSTLKKSLGEEHSAKSQELATYVADVVLSLENRFSSVVSVFKENEKKSLKTLEKFSKESLKLIRELRKEIPDISPIIKLIERVEKSIPQIPEQIPPTSEEVRDLMEELEGEDRLDASAIKNLPELVEKNVASTGLHGPLWALQDVDIAGITAGQSIEWNGTRWVAFTPSGSGGTPVWGEVLEDQGPGTAFTLDHTPISGTLRLFRGGAYQRAGVSEDYTLSGTTVTLTTALQAGELLVADYSYT